MEHTNGNARPEAFTANVQMRLVIRESSYAAVGRVMDAIQHVVREEVEKADVGRARFDFTGFDTHPCKAAQMASAFDMDAPELATPTLDDF
jgi:hypothetical protein